MSDRYRGRTTRQRNVAEKVARDWAERRAASEPTETRSWTSRRRRSTPRSSCSTRPPGRARERRRRPSRRDAGDRPRRGGGPTAHRPEARAAASRTSPRSRALLHDTGSFGSLRERLGPARDGARDARQARRADVGPARREVVPRGGARARAGPGSGSAGSRATRRSATGSPRSWARGSATRRSSRSSSRGPRSPTSAASSSRTRPPPGSRPSPRGAAGRREGPRGQRPGAAPGDARARTTCPPSSARLAARARGSARTRSCAELLERGYAPVLEVAGRGEFARRGGIVDVFPPSAPLPGPDRVLRRRDRLAARLRPHRPAQRRARSSEVVLLPATRVPPAGRRRRRRSGPASAGWRPRLPERLAAGPRPLRRRGDGPDRPPAVTAGRALAAGDAAEVWARARRPVHRPRPPRSGRPCSSSTSPATSPRPPSSCGARPTSGTRSWSRPGDLPKDWPVVVPPAARLEERASTARGPSS